MKSIISLTLAVLAAVGCKATVYTWNGSVSNNPATAANWSPAGIPATTDTVMMVTGGNACLLTANRSIAKFTIASGILDMGGFSLSVTGDATFSGGIVTNGNLNVTAATSNSTVLSGSVFTVSGNLSVASGYIYLNGGNYSGSVLLQQTGNTNTMGGGHAVFNGNTTLANIGNALFATQGNLIFNGNTTIQSKGTNSSFILDNTSANLYNDDVTFTNSSSGPLYCSYSGTTYFNGNITVNSSNSGPMIFGVGATNFNYLKAGHTISAGSLGFSKGVLYLKQFIQMGTDSVNLLFTGTAGISLGSSSAFSGPVAVTAADITVAGVVFNDAATFTKTGGVNNNNGGIQNIFNSTCTINQQSNTGYFMLGLNSNELFKGDIILSSSGTGAIYLGSNNGTPVLYPGKVIKTGFTGYSSGNLFISGLTQLGTTPFSLVQTGTAGLIVGDSTTFNAAVSFTASDIRVIGCTFNDSVTFTKTGGTNNNNNSYQNIFNSTCTINQQSNTGYFMLSLGSSDQFNGDIIVTSTGTGAIYIGSSLTSSSPVLAAGKIIKTGPAGFSGGSLSLGGLTQLGIIPITLNFPGASTLVLGYGSTFNAQLNLTAANIHVVGNVFNDTVSFTKTGGFDNTNAGYLNIFNSACYINQQSTTGHFILGQNSNDTFNGDVYVSSSGGAYIYLGYPTGTGKPVMAAGKTIKNGVAPFSSGGLLLCQFTQLGNEPLLLTFTGSATLLSFVRSNIGGDVTSITPSVIFNNSVFQGLVDATKTGSVAASSPGGNRFFKNISLTENGSANFYMGTASPDSCFRDCFLQAGGSGYMMFAQISANNYVAGDMNITNAGATGTMYIVLCNQASSSLTINGKLNAGNISPGPLSIVTLAQYGKLYVTGGMNVTNANSGASGQVFIGQEASSLVQVSGPCLIENTATGNASSISIGHSGNIFFDNNLSVINSASSPTSSSIILGYYVSSSVNVQGQASFINSSPSAISNMTIGRLGTLNFASTFDLLHSAVSASATVIIANTSGCVVTINGPATITSTGSGTTKRTTIGNTGSVIFNGVLTIQNDASAGNCEIYCNAGNTNYYNNDILVSSTQAASDGIIFGSSTGIGRLAAGKTISVGSGGFIAGQLYFRNFLQTGGTGQILLLTGSSWMSQYDSEWGGNVVFASPRIDTRGTLYNGTAYLEKTGATGDLSAGGNRFMLDAELRNSGSGGFTMGNVYADSAFQNLLINNIGTKDMVFANNYEGHYVKGNLTVNNAGSGFSNTITLANYNGSASNHTSLYIGGDTQLNNSTLATTSNITAGAYGDIIFNGKLDVVNSTPGTGSTINFGGQSTSTNIINGSATFVNSSPAGTSNLYIGFSGKTIFNNSLSCFNLSTGTSSNVNFAYNSTATLRVAGDAYFSNEGSSTASTLIGWYADVTFGGKLTCINNVSGNSGTFTIASVSASDVSVADSATFVNNGAGTIKQMYVGSGGTITFNGPVLLTNNSSALSSQIYCNHTGINYYNDNISIESTHAASKGVLFGQSGTGYGTLAAGKTVSIGNAGFIGGVLMFRHFTQLGTTPQAMTLTGTGSFVNYDSQWNGNVSLRAPQMETRGTLYNASAYIEKTGAINDNSYGANVFNGTATIANSGIGNMITGGSAGDDFNATVTYIKTGSGLMQPTYNAVSSYAGDINLNTNSAITFGQAASGRTFFDGNTAQSINNTGTSPQPVFTRITTQNLISEITLHMPITVSTDLRLQNGNVVSSSASMLSMDAGSSVSLVSDSAFVHGPCRKTGNTAFTYPIGKNGYYRPMATTAAAGSVINQFTAEYFESDPHAFGANKALTLHHISNCEYWSLERNAGTTNVSATLSFRNFDNNNGCSGVVDPSSLVVAGWNGTQWNDLGATSFTGTAANGTLNSGSAMTVYGPLTLATRTGLNPLPIELLNFTAAGMEGKVKLEWQTASEKNNDYFTVEKSKDGEAFIEVQRIKGAGNSTALLSYLSWDQYPFDGTSYYRLKQTDYDGTFTYSPAKMVTMNKNNSSMKVYPNPFNEVINIDTFHGEEPVAITLTDMTGKTILNHPYASGQIQLDTATLSKGSYILKIVSVSDTSLLKVIKK